jgi:hypothetical protein
LLGLCLLSLGFSVAAYVDLGGSAGARPGDPGLGARIDSSEIRNNTIRSRDVRAIGVRDLGFTARFGPTVTVPAGNLVSVSATADCPPGDTAIGRGYQATDGAQLVLEDDAPTSRTGGAGLNRWHLSFFNLGNASASVLPSVTCMNN